MPLNRYLAAALLGSAGAWLVAAGEAESGLLAGLQAALDQIHPIATEVHTLSDEDLALIAGVRQDVAPAAGR